jgi:hypothetical protein
MARAAAPLTAFVTWIALALQLALIIEQMTANGASVGAAL